MMRASFSESAGTEYARTYAENPISEEFQYLYGADCANFSSQILEAGGVAHVNNYPDQNKGWWHYTDGSPDIFGRYKHESSQSWRLADVFSKYQGAYAKTKVHNTFSKSIKKGDFIATDHTSDGKWDHVGYVVANDTYSANYNGKTYYDYQVAQHTTNYLAWTSSSTNGWENEEDGGATYARLRRAS